MSIEQVNNHEIIDNEQRNIIEALEKKEELVALWILTSIDNQIKDYDVDLCIDNSNNKYRFIVNNKIALDIPLDLNQIPEMWKYLVEIFNKIDSADLEYDLILPNDFADIQIDWDTMFWKLWFDKTVLNTESIQTLFWENSLPNDKIRTIFKFISTIRNNPDEYRYRINGKSVLAEKN